MVLLVSVAHYHEAMNLMAEEQASVEVRTFVEALPDEARRLHDDALAAHAEVVAATSRVRNETTFHYPGEQTTKALTKALEQLANAKRARRLGHQSAAS
jgi:hypothetical protein